MKYARAFLLLICLSAMSAAQNWPSFRGSNASGVADGANPPVAWDGEKSVNVLWKTPIPGVGYSSPVVWGNRVFITTAISADSKTVFVNGPTQTAQTSDDTSQQIWRVYCLDKNTGRIIWEKDAYAGVPKVKRHVKGSHANSTPATDGSYLVTFFGSEGLYCYDMDGKLVWKQNLGTLVGGWTSDPTAQWGFASSPIIYRNLVIVQCDSQKDSFIAAFNLKDGKQVWRTARDEDTSWSSPVIYAGAARAELIASGTKYYRGYDPLTGKELWRLADGADVKIPTPVAAQGLFFLGGGSTHVRRVFYAVRAGASGDITPSAGQLSTAHIAWQNPAKPHIVTPLAYGSHVYVCTDNGVLSVFDIKTGDEVYRARLGSGGAFSASPVAADGKVYFINEEGEVYVIKAGPLYELQSKNPMGEVVMATPAITNKMLIIRTQRHLFGISERVNAKPQVKS
jgi:outer membrane protein assembly factor BamB